MHIRFLLPLVLIVNVSFGMEDSEDFVLEGLMTKISTWEEMKPFACHIIAYETDSLNIGLKNYYKLYEDRPIQFGLVDSQHSVWRYSTGESDCDPRGYALARLIHKKNNSKNCGIINRFIFDKTLWVRLATQEETQKIHRAIADKKAHFEDTVNLDVTETRDIVDDFLDLDFFQVK